MKAMVLCHRAETDRRSSARATHTNGLRDELADQLLEVTAGSFPSHDLHHLLANLADLTALCVTCALHLLTKQDGGWHS